MDLAKKTTWIQEHSQNCTNAIGTKSPGGTCPSVGITGPISGGRACPRQKKSRERVVLGY